MYSPSKGAEPSFFLKNIISRDQRGMARYARVMALPGWDSDDPLDAAFSDAPAKRRKRKGDTVTPIEFRDARGQLGHDWGLERPLTLTEFGRVLRLGGVRPDQSVRDYERGKTQVSGPLSLLVELLLAGAKPAKLDEILDR